MNREPSDETPFSETIVFVDESGDHGIEKVDPSYPLFVLLFVVFKKSAYINRFVPAIGNLKFRLFGHDGVILHEREIRKDEGPFAVLGNRERKERFLTELTSIIERTPFDVIATVCDKRKLAPGTTAVDLYHEALRNGLERLYPYLSSFGDHEKRTHIVCEARGGVEDEALELAFRRTCEGANAHGHGLPFELVVASKKSNSVGMQLADLIARPVGLHVLRPAQANRAFDMIEPRLLKDPLLGTPGWGLVLTP